MFAEDARTAFQGCKAPWDAQLDELYKGAKPEEKKNCQCLLHCPYHKYNIIAFYSKLTGQIK